MEKTLGTFAELGIAPVYIERLAEKSISRPSAVQCLAIPPLLEGKSIMFRSATGTGKTFAYLLPALQRIIEDREQADLSGAKAYAGPALAVCAPTLELCSQIKTEIEFLCAGKHGVTLLGASVNITRQIESLRKAKPLAVAGSPGRLLLLAKMGKLKLGGLRFLIFDEADRLTAAECREETAAFAQTAAAKSANLITAACSATVSVKTGEYLRPLLENAPLLETDEHEILRERIEHWAIFSEGRKKTQTLVSLLAAAKPKKVLVFSNRVYDAGKLVAALQHRKINAAGLYSGMDKKERKAAIDRFRSGKAAVLVASDLAARGLDIPGISHVVALDVSEVRDSYIHRAGRTGRAGKRGIMISIGDEVEMRRLAALEKKLGITVHPKELYQGRILQC
jgi:superfamily II DNA/RNA helicase